MENVSLERSTALQADHISPVFFGHQVYDHALNVVLKMLLAYKDKKIGIKKISSRLNIHERTLNRFLNLENKPNYQTLLKIYKHHFNEYDESKLIDLLPEYVKEHLKPFLVNSRPVQVQVTNVVDELLRNNPVAADIYVLAGTGVFHLNSIKKKFGLYGLDVLNQLLKLKILKEVEKNYYSLGEWQAEFAGETILKAGLAVTQNHFSVLNAEELNHNHIGFLAEGLNEESYLKWLKIDQEAFLKKSQIMQDSQNHGPLRVYTFMATDRLSYGEENEI